MKRYHEQGNLFKTNIVYGETMSLAQYLTNYKEGEKKEGKEKNEREREKDRGALILN